MALSTDATLPRTHTAVFPDRCVACGLRCRDSFTWVATHSIGWLLRRLFARPGNDRPPRRIIVGRACELDCWNSSTS